MAVATLQIRFQAKPGAHMSNSQAARYGNELYRLRRDEQVSLTAGNVVESARLKRSPLHDYFEWDDTVAAVQFRERQARTMLASIVCVEVDVGNGETLVTEPVRFFVNVVREDNDGGSEYIPLDVVQQNPDLEQQMLRTAARELSAFRDKYRRLKGIDGIVDWDALAVFLANIGVK